jgi:hypothetical protein
MNTYQTKRFLKRTSTKMNTVLTSLGIKIETAHKSKAVVSAKRTLFFQSLSNAYNLLQTLSEQDTSYPFTQVSCTPSQGKALIEITYENLDIQVEFKQFGHEFEMKYKTPKGWVTSASFHPSYDHNIYWHHSKSEETKKTQEFFANGKGIMAMVCKWQLEEKESC